MNGILSLGKSRKFWITLAAAIGTTVLHVRGQVSADVWAGSMVALAGALSLAIAHEDNGSKGATATPSSDANKPPART